jgi:gas vesicle protein
MADSHNTGGLVFLSFVLGGLVGGILGVLFAPKSGRETRADLAKAAEDLKGEAQKVTKDALGRIENFVEDSKASLSKLTTKEAKEKA